MHLSDTFLIVDLRCIWKHIVQNQFLYIIKIKHQNRQQSDVEDRKIPKTQSFSFVFIYLNILIK